MKAGYEKPTIEFDEYELDAAIAAGCVTKVTLAPMPYDGHDICSEYAQPLTVYSFSRSSSPTTDTWNDSVSCTCYYSSGEIPMMTS